MTETAALSKEQIGILHHSIGMVQKNHRRSLKWWLSDEMPRNRFCVPVGNIEDTIIMRTLVGLGLAKEGMFINQGQDRYYHVTEAGIIEAKKHRPEW